MTWVIVPAYNEEQKIGRVVRGLFEHGFNHVVVIDDGSGDNTAQVAHEAGAIVLKHIFNRGQGAALSTGNRYCQKVGAQSVVHFDGDDQFDPVDIAPALEFLKNNNAKVLLGSRFLDKKSQVPFFKKNIILPVSRLINYFLTGVKLTDAHNGFRILTREALEKIEITQDGMAHNSEIVAQIKKYQLPFVEFGVTVKYNEYGQGVRGGLKILWDWLVDKFIK